MLSLKSMNEDQEYQQMIGNFLKALDKVENEKDLSRFTKKYLEMDVELNELFDDYIDERGRFIHRLYNKYHSPKIDMDEFYEQCVGQKPD